VSRRLQENIVLVFLFCVFVAAIIASAGYGPRARLVPIPIAALGAILVVAQMILQNLRADQDLHVDLLDFIAQKPRSKGNAEASVEPPEVPSETAPPDRLEQSSPGGASTTKRELAAFALVGVFVGLILLLGPYAAILLLIAGFFIFTRQYPPLRGLIYAVGYTALAYAMFSYLLDVQFETSIIGLRLF
jgi:Tripartite tricarboxylate transporter TctB family